MSKFKAMNAYVIIDITEFIKEKETPYQTTKTGIIVPTAATKVDDNRIGYVIDISPAITETSLNIGEKVIALSQGGYMISDPENPDIRLLAIHHNDIICRYPSPDSDQTPE